MKEIKEISRESFDTADDERTGRGNIQVENFTVYGFYVDDLFFFTADGKYYRAVETFMDLFAGDCPQVGM